MPVFFSTGFGKQIQMFIETVTYSAAFIEGLLSFFSGCVLPLIPAYFSFITGYSLEELTTANTTVRKRVMVATLAFVSGFSFVFILMGATATLLGEMLYRYNDWVRIIGGLIVVIMGVHLIGWLRIPFLDVEKRLMLNRKPVHIFGTFLVGMAFAAGWSPCIGPLLGSVLVMAGSKETVFEGILLLSVYSLGLAMPFIFISFFIDRLLGFLKQAKKALQYINTVAGLLLIFIGTLLMTNNLSFIAE